MNESDNDHPDDPDGDDPSNEPLLPDAAWTTFPPIKLSDATREAIRSATAISTAHLSEAIENLAHTTAMMGKTTLPQWNAASRAGMRSLSMSTGTTSTSPDIVLTPPPSGEREAHRHLRQLHRLLKVRFPDLAERLDGAWLRISSTDPDSFSQATHSLCELRIWFLRRVAPAHDVIPWAQAHPKSDQLLENGVPTYFASALYLLDPKLPPDYAWEMARAFTRTLSHVQKVKHGSLTAGRNAIRAELMIFQGFASLALADN